MPRALDPFRLLRFAVAGWMNHEQQQTLDYLGEENRILHAQFGTRRLGLDDEQRRRLAVRPSGWDGEYWLKLPPS